MVCRSTKDRKRTAFVELTAPSRPVAIERLQRFAERLCGTSLSQNERFELRLALEELLRNALEWGNRYDARKQLRLAYRLRPDHITVRIQDEGRGFDARAVPDPSVDPAAHLRSRRVAGKRGGGWGIFLARKLADEVRFSKKGNTVFLTKYFKEKSEARIQNSEVGRRTCRRSSGF